MRIALTFFSLFLLFSVLSSAEPINTLTQQEKDLGWKLLFNGSTPSGWHSADNEAFPSTGWKIKDGILTIHKGTGGGDIVTSKQYSDFELKLEFRMTKGANSGIKYFVQSGTHLGLEYQILDDEHHSVDKNHTLASLYDLIPAKDKPVKPVGEWNQARIVVNNGHVEHWLNGNKVVEFDRFSQCFEALLQTSKYKDYENFGRHAQGHILLQDHNATVSFRNIKIRTF